MSGACVADPQVDAAAYGLGLGGDERREGLRQRHPPGTACQRQVGESEALAPLIAAQPEEVRRAIHLWFGDERFVPAGDPERNDLLATPLIAAGIRESPTPRRAPPHPPT